MHQLTTTEGLAIAGLIIAYLLVLLWLRSRARTDPEFQSYQFTGLPIPEDFEKVFGAYGGGSGIEGLICLRDGIRVTYKDGSAMTFMPVPAGSTLYVEDGEFKVDPPAVPAS